MAMNWNFLSKKREDDSQFLSQDYQPPIPHSKINLEQRFGLYTDSGPENQYENWRSYDQQLQNNRYVLPALVPWCNLGIMACRSSQTISFN